MPCMCAHRPLHPISLGLRVHTRLSPRYGVCVPMCPSRLVVRCRLCLSIHWCLQELILRLVCARANPNRATLLAVDCCLLVQSNGECPCPMFPGKGVALFWCVIYEFIWSRGRACGPGAKPCSVVREARPAYVVKNCSAEPCLRLYVPASRVCSVAIH